MPGVKKVTIQYRHVSWKEASLGTKRQSKKSSNVIDNALNVT